jgi:hypothetical protein
MKDLAYKVMGLHSLYMDTLDYDDGDLSVQLQDEMEDAALDLAREVAFYNPLEGHSRLGEVYAYAHRRQVCVEHAIVELVNTALSHPDLLIGTKNTEV